MDLRQVLETLKSLCWQCLAWLSEEINNEIEKRTGKSKSFLKNQTVKPCRYKPKLAERSTVRWTQKRNSNSVSDGLIRVKLESS